MITIQQIIDYLSEHISDSVSKYIFVKEIYKKDPSCLDYINAYNDMKQSKWYRELADDQWENGSWGKFHGGDVTAQKKQKFPCTEAALRRARELSLTKDDPIIERCIKIMQKYALREEPYPDYVERHKDEGKGFIFGIPFGVSANINMFDSENPVIKPLRDVVAETIKTAFTTGCFDENFWGQKVSEYHVPSTTHPGIVYSAMILQNSNCMDDTLQRQYLDYIWNKKDGLGYVSKFPPANIQDLENKNFIVWLTLLEILKGFSLFPDFMKESALPHLLNETDRLINGDVILPKSPVGYSACGHCVYGRYADSWRDNNQRKTDMILRIARILVKC